MILRYARFTFPEWACLTNTLNREGTMVLNIGNPSLSPPWSQLASRNAWVTRDKHHHRIWNLESGIWTNTTTNSNVGESVPDRKTARDCERLREIARETGRDSELQWETTLYWPESFRNHVFPPRTLRAIHLCPLALIDSTLPLSDEGAGEV